MAEKNQRDLQVQREQAERHVSYSEKFSELFLVAVFVSSNIDLCSQRIAETLDVEIKRWTAGKEGNIRALLSTLQYVCSFIPCVSSIFI